MPRCARVKSEDSIYHIMVRSIDDTLLFRNDSDKDMFLEVVKKYQEIYKFKVYAYCLMDNHAHLIIDVLGADISRIMGKINQVYAQKFNKKHSRRGHLFWDRFKSKIIEDDRYLLTLSGYIHKNPSDLADFKGKIQNYNYSSLGIYLNLRVDNLDLVDKSFVLQLFNKYRDKAIASYLNFVGICNDEKVKDDMDFKNEKSEYRSERRVLVRDFNPADVIEYAASCTNQNPEHIGIKHVKDLKKFKAITVLLLQSVCDMTQKEICDLIGNMSQSYASRLAYLGFELMRTDKDYIGIINKFIGRYAI